MNTIYTVYNVVHKPKESILDTFADMNSACDYLKRVRELNKERPNEFIVEPFVPRTSAWRDVNYDY